MLGKEWVVSVFSRGRRPHRFLFPRNSSGKSLGCLLSSGFA